ncbi:MAG: DUF2520 domain-containing protein [Candidatus Nanopelagicales bacterium]
MSDEILDEMPESPPRLRVGLVGVGRAGSVLAAALDAAGHRVVAVHAASERSRARAAEMLPRAAVVSIAEVFAAADLVLITVPDDELPGLVEAIALADLARPGQFVAHSSGRYGISVLAPLPEILPLALHPVMTLTGRPQDVDRLVGCPFGVTAPPPLEAVASALVVEMGGEPMIVAEDRRSLYHAALAHSANHLITLVTEAMDLLQLAGVAEPARMLGPLLSAALDNALAYGDRALTGPVSRGDSGTVAAHLGELEQVSPAMGDAYRALARRTADRALAAGTLDPVLAARLLEVLAARGS